MARPITGGGIPTPVYNRMKNAGKRLDKVRDNVSMRVQDWNKKVDQFSTRGTAPRPPASKAPQRRVVTSGARAGSFKSNIRGPYK